MAVKSKSIIDQVVEERAAGKKPAPVDPNSIIGQQVAKSEREAAGRTHELAAKLSDERSYDCIPKADKDRLFPQALQLTNRYSLLLRDPAKNERDIMFVAADMRDIEYEIRAISEFYGRNSKRIAELNGLAVKLGENGCGKKLVELGKQLEKMKAEPFYSPKREKEADDLRREFFEDAVFEVQEKLEAMSELKTGEKPRFG